MNKKKLIDKAKKDYEKTIKHINVAVEFLEPIEKMLPEGWRLTFNTHEIYPIKVIRGDWNSDKKMPIDEFKLVCKLFEMATNNSLTREVDASQENNEIKNIEARGIYFLKGIDLAYEIIMHNPDHKCDITWKTHTYREAIVDDACLGLVGETQ